MAAGNSTATEGSTEHEHIVKDTIACSRQGIEPWQVRVYTKLVEQQYHLYSITLALELLQALEVLPGSRL